MKCAPAAAVATLVALAVQVAVVVAQDVVVVRVAAMLLPVVALAGAQLDLRDGHAVWILAALVPVVEHVADQRECRGCQCRARQAQCGPCGDELDCAGGERRQQ